MTTVGVSLHDIEDVEGFVQAAINRGRLRLSPDQRDELAQEGLLILYRLAREYQPGRNGLDPTTSKFSGYAAKYLPGKLSDAQHRLRGDRTVTKPDGKREWKYNETPASLDHMTAESPEGADHIRELHQIDYYANDVAGVLSKALDEQWALERDLTIKVGVLFGLGEEGREIARILRVTMSDVERATSRIQGVAHRLGALEAA